MAERNEHLVVIKLEALPAGRPFEIWPPHITIVPWFWCDAPDKLDKLLAKIAAKHPAFFVKAGKIEEWGQKDRFKVQMIDDPGQLHRLHWEVFHSLEKNGFFIHQKDFLGAKYAPHVALRNHLQTGSARPKGEEILVSNFSLISQIRLKKSGRMIKSLLADYELR